MARREGPSARRRSGPATDAPGQGTDRRGGAPDAASGAPGAPSGAPGAPSSRYADRADLRAAATDPAVDPVAVARQICLDQLAHAPRTRAELAAVLTRRGVPDEASAQVLGRLTEVGMVDDALFAQMWVTSRHRGRGLASRALSQELRGKGVEDELVRQAVETLDPVQELATARQLVARRLPSTRTREPEVRVRRLVGLLARKGYPAGVAFGIVREALAAEGVDPELVPDVDGDVDPDGGLGEARGAGRAG